MDAQNEVNHEESEQNEFDGTKNGADADSTRTEHRTFVLVNLESEKREPADGEDGNDDDEHAHNAFPLVVSPVGAQSVEPCERILSRRRVKPQRERDTAVCHEHRQHLYNT